MEFQKFPQKRGPTKAIWNMHILQIFQSFIRNFYFITIVNYYFLFGLFEKSLKVSLKREKTYLNLEDCFSQ